MRQIKFRGKRKDNGEWVVGSLVKIIRVNIKFYILPLNTVIDDDSKMFDSLIEIRPNTVSQFIGITDKNGKEIYEGDILEERFVACDRQDTGLIDGEYCSGHYIETKRFVANMNLDYENDLITVGFFDGGCDKLLEEDELYNYPSGIYLIGNIHDNPELLNEKQ